jgi:glycosyltransferase involved in cell wall biosynthesis
MKILHLCSYYVGSKIYKNLFETISETTKKYNQNVFIPVRKVEHLNVNRTEEHGICLYYIKCLSLMTRLSFLFKQMILILAFKKIVQKSSDILSSDIIHAHTLYSDGFLAWYLKYKYQIPYIVTVRTTDVNIFEKYLPHWKPFTKQVLKNAECVVFLSEQHKKPICLKYGNVLRKTVIVPNGVDQFWIENSILKKENILKLGKKGIYVGEINKNKNIKKAIHAFFEAQNQNDSIFVVIGGTYQDYKKIYGRLNLEVLGRVQFLGRANDKELIKKHLRDSDVFIMPSHMETFGLVYLEAISQCTPVVYSLGQGFDGLFPVGVVGFKCDPKDSDSIQRAVGFALDKFPNGLDFDLKKYNPISDFSWDEVTSILLDQVY